MRSAAFGLLVAAILAVFGSAAGAAPAYRAYAEALAQTPPPAILIRPDLEEILDSLAQNARIEKRRKPVSASAQFKIAARAQAIDMVLGDYVGHKSLKGYSFHARFAAFAEDTSPQEVVRELDLTVATGERVALRGPNGSGKTTVLRCITGALLPSAGEVRVAGYEAGTENANSLVGASLSQERSFYLRLTGRENLSFFAQFRHRSRADAAAR